MAKYKPTKATTKFWNWFGNIWYVNDFDPIIELKNDSYLTAFYSGNVSQAKLDAMFDYIRQF